MNVRSIAATVLGLFASLVTAGCGAASFHASKSTNSPDVPGSSVSISTENGSITVNGGGAKSVASNGVWIAADVFATTAERAAAVNIVSIRDAVGALSVRVEWPGGKREPNEGCNFEVDVPTTTSGVVVRSANGSIHVRGRCGPVSARTSNGAVEVTDAPGKVDAKSMNGAVAATLDQSNQGPVSLETSNGAIRLAIGAAFRGRLTAETSNGQVDIDVADPKTGAPARVSGAKRADLVVGVGGEPSTLKTSNGSIKVERKK